MYVRIRLCSRSLSICSCAYAEIVCSAVPLRVWLNICLVSATDAACLLASVRAATRKTLVPPVVQVDLRTNKTRRLRRRMARLATGLTKEARHNRI